MVESIVLQNVTRVGRITIDLFSIRKHRKTNDIRIVLTEVLTGERWQIERNSEERFSTSVSETKQSLGSPQRSSVKLYH